MITTVVTGPVGPVPVAGVGGGHDRSTAVGSVPAPAAEVDAVLSTSAMAHRLGVAPASLRTWALRYGVGPSEHTPGRHRRYTPADVARLEIMNHALQRGARPREAARVALATAPVPAGTPTVAAGDPGGPGTGGRRGGRSVLRVVGTVDQAPELGRAVVLMDTAAVQRLIVEATATGGVAWAWDEVVRPVMGAVSLFWESTDTGVEMEHLLSECVTSVMARVMLDAPAPTTARAVLLASVPGERHTLPLRVLAAVLAQRRVRTSLLGADVPVRSLVAAVERVGPSAVLLWAQLDVNADPTLLAAVPRLRTRARVFVGGPAWDEAPLPPLVVALPSLGAAVTALTAAAGTLTA